jgi:putative ABC transport system permease protein
MAMGLKRVLRRLGRSPLFTLVTVLTLAIGIGATTAIFSVLEGVLLKPLPYPHPEELIALSHVAPGVGPGDIGSAPFLYFSYRDGTHTFQNVGLWRTGAGSLTGLGPPERVETLDITEGILPLLQVQPALGRLFTERDDSPGGAETVILAYEFWNAKYGGDRAVIGRTLQLDGRAREVIGVLPPAFRFLDRKPVLLVPLQLNRAKTFLGNFSYAGMARLKPGVTLAQANTDAVRIVAASLKSFPPFPGYDAKMFVEARLAPNLQPTKQDLVGDIGKVLWVLMGTIGIVLLIACANVANLMLVRAEGRQQELAIRAALGAGWGRIAGELLVESVILGLVGGVIGLALAYGALRLLISIAPAHLPRLDEISIDGPVLVFSVAISLIASLLFSFIPVLKHAGPQVANALRAGGRTVSQSKERHRSRDILVVVQVALALVLLVSSGLMIRTFLALRHVEPGFSRPEEVLTLRVAIPETQVADPVKVVRMQQEMLDKVGAVPGVVSAAFTATVPMAEDAWWDPIFAEDHVYADDKIPPLRRYKFVSPGYLNAIGNPLIAGRDFAWADVYGKRQVAMVSENLARELWQDPRAAIGKRIREHKLAPWREIVGVVADERDDGVDKKAPTIAFWPTMMDNFSGDEVALQRSLALVVRSHRTGSPDFLNDVSRAIWSVNPDVPVAGVRTLQQLYNRSLARSTFALVMLGAAGAMALLLGLVGIYGVISYSVSQRQREIGIRMALGSPMKQLTRMFVGDGLRLALIGVACGMAAAAMLTQVMKTILFAVNPLDPLTFVAVALGLILAAALASYLPALRASSVDPVEALKAD